MFLFLVFGQELGDGWRNGWTTRLVAGHHAGASLGGGVLGAAVVGQHVGDGGDVGRSPRRLAGHRVPVRQHVVVVLVECVDLRGSEFASRDLLREQDIEFVEGAILDGTTGVRESERTWRSEDGL